MRLFGHLQVMFDLNYKQTELNDSFFFLFFVRNFSLEKENMMHAVRRTSLANQLNRFNGIFLFN